MGNIKKILILIVFFTKSSLAQQTLHADVLVVGGGASGVTAGIQSARLGAKTIIAEPTVWLGGMISSAGVSAFDGNHEMPSGLWAEFRERIYQLYGGPSKVATGWVSNTLFEPHVGDSILKVMVSNETALQVLYQYQFLSTLKEGNTIKGAIFIDKNSNKKITILAKQTIDATELGDVMASAKIPYNIGMEASSQTGENVKIFESNNIIQDITYVAILKDYGTTKDCTIARPANYDSLEFDGCCKDFCSSPAKLISNVSAQKMLEYGKLPNGKYMINWPAKGNDIYLNLIELNPQQRAIELQKAKAKTLRFVYFIQHQLGFKNLGLAENEFPTKDHLPLMEYNREGRRVVGLVRYTLEQLATPFKNNNTFYRTGIAVGDYPIDHHHKENLAVAKDLGFYPVPSYTIPFGALVPKGFKGIVIAEKGISVSNVVNGTTRLQPIVMLIGQAAGSIAATAAKQNTSASKISIRKVQDVLLNANTYIMPFADVKPTNPYFKAIQHVGATGIIKGVGQPNAWANRTWFYPDSTISLKDFVEGMKMYYSIKEQVLVDEILTTTKACSIIASLIKTSDKTLAEDLKSHNLYQTQITRKALAYLVDKYLQPFAMEIDYLGNIRKSKTNNNKN